MGRLWILVSVCAAIWSSAAYSTAQSPEILRLPLPDERDAVLSVPQGWNYLYRVSRSPGPSPFFQCDFLIPEPESSKVVLIALMPLRGDPVQAVESLAKATGSGSLEHCVERELKLLPLHGSTVQGVFYRLTRRAPDRGEWKHLTQGVLTAGGVMMSFSVFHHAADSPASHAAVNMIRQMTLEPAAATLQLPGRSPNWRLVAPRLGLRPLAGSYAADTGHRRLVASAGDLQFTLQHTPAEQPGGAEFACEQFLKTLAKSPEPLMGLDRSSVGPFPRVDYFVPLLNGKPVDQRHAWLFRVHDGAWIDLHVSKARFVDADLPKLDRLLRETTLQTTP
jgi:hypothetical protein